MRDDPHAVDGGVARYAGTGAKLLLWGVIVVPIAAWGLHLGGSYALVGYACDTGATWLLHLVTVVTLAPVLGTGLLAWRAWRRAGIGWESAGGDLAARTRFMAILGVVLSAAGGLLIVVEWMPTLFLGPCA